MNNVNGLHAAPDLQDKDESIFQALMTAIVEHQLLPGSKLPEEALAEVKVARQAWLESAREHGDPIPEPRYRPAIYAARRVA